jgi:ParB family chromosome partitioning protein
MQLRHIDIANLTVSAANMRGKGKPDIANILPSVRARGVLVPLIVRPSRSEAETTERSEGNCDGSPETFEIVAGKRRYHAALAVAEENGGECEPLPCAVLDDADDGKNIRRFLSPDSAAEAAP